jgi:hypothetical protein
MNIFERRYSPRYKLRVPLKFHSLDFSEDPQEFEVETSNISRTGLFFISRTPLRVGTSIHLSLRLPMEVSGGSPKDVECLGHVVRRQIYSDGAVGYGVQTDFRPPSISQSPSEPARVSTLNSD